MLVFFVNLFFFIKSEASAVKNTIDIMKINDGIITRQRSYHLCHGISLSKNKKKLQRKKKQRHHEMGNFNEPTK